MSGREVHENRNFKIRHEVEQKVLELIFFGPIDRQLAENNSAYVAQQSGGAKVEKSLVYDGHGIPCLLEKEDGVAGVELVWGSDGLLHQ